MITLRVRPFVGHPPSTTIRLNPSKAGYAATVIKDDHDGSPVRRHVVTVAGHVAERHLQLLYHLSIPLVLTHPLDADGESVELTIHSVQGHVTVSWWGYAPRRCAQLEAFVRWLRETTDTGMPPGSPLLLVPPRASAPLAPLDS